VLIEPGVWVALKRALKSCILEIQSYDPVFLITQTALKPEPIKIDVKVAMIGDERLYRLLYIFEDDFKKIFKIKADFDTVMDNTEENLVATCSFIRKSCEEEKLLHFDCDAVAEIIEYGVRLAGRKNKISTEFSKLVDLLREASYWAKKDGAKYVTSAHVNKALAERIYRVNMIEDKIKELIREGTIMIDIEGERVGQVNGLSVIQLGDHTFGRPSKITAEVSLGKLGVVNIEREADLSGKTHNKGVLILSGYLRGKYAQDKPLSMSASLCFEQSYSGIDGDSASSTELYAILSSLADLPIRQDIAVTGSVNQKGEIQPIGGVNEKIEGFFDICKAKGLSSSQGVIIPELNIPDLMLRNDVIEAVASGKFHIYPVKTVNEGIEILTGVKIGKRKEDGTYEKDSINYLVEKRLTELASKLTKYQIEEEEKP
jgi:lon-related putative ATP-dependent protease